MNLHNVCLNCSNDLEYIGRKYVRNELGLKVPVETYHCKNCENYFIECTICEGKGFDETLNEIEDCIECNGFGKIPISKSLLFEL